MALHRSFHAQANPTQPAWAVRGLLGQLVAAVDRIRPVAVVIGFDDPERSVRRETWPQYKANRVDTQVFRSRANKAAAATRHLDQVNIVAAVVSS